MTYRFKIIYNMKKPKKEKPIEKHHGFYLNGAHVSCSKKPTAEMISALSEMIERAKKNL